MAALYIMPGPLGGQELEFIGSAAGFEIFKWPLAENLYAQLRLPAGLATAVKPPLPEEPPAFSVVQIGASFFEKRDDAGINWWDIVAQTWLTWEQICSIGTPVRLVPDPFAEPVELPWLADTEPISALRPHLIVEDDVPVVCIKARPFGDGEWRLRPDVARIMARALWAAADAAEKEQS